MANSPQNSACAKSQNSDILGYSWHRICELWIQLSYDDFGQVVHTHMFDSAKGVMLSGWENNCSLMKIK